MQTAFPHRSVARLWSRTTGACLQPEPPNFLAGPHRARRLPQCQGSPLPWDGATHSPGQLRTPRGTRWKRTGELELIFTFSEEAARQDLERSSLPAGG